MPFLNSARNASLRASSNRFFRRFFLGSSSMWDALLGNVSERILAASHAAQWGDVVPSLLGRLSRNWEECRDVARLLLRRYVRWLGHNSDVMWPLAVKTDAGKSIVSVGHCPQCVTSHNKDALLGYLKPRAA
jgi:hypothetical protein